MSSDPDDVRSMSAADLKRRLDLGERLVVLDVRQDDERAFCSIAMPDDARDLHVPLGDVQARLDPIRRAASSGPLVVYCHHGVRSLAAARWLAAQGVGDVHNLEGGIDAWSTGVDPNLPRY